MEKKDVINNMVKMTEREQDLANMAYKSGMDEAVSTRQQGLDVERKFATNRDVERHRLFKQDAVDVQSYRDHSVTHNNMMKATECLKIAIGIGIIIALLI